MYVLSKLKHTYLSKHEKSHMNYMISNISDLRIEYVESTPRGGWIGVVLI